MQAESLESADDNLFELSDSSKFSDWTAVFDIRAELEPFQVDWPQSPYSSPSRSRCESTDGEQACKTRDAIRETFCDGCANLSADIRRALGDWDSGQEIVPNDLFKRLDGVAALGDQLAVLAPEMAEFVGLKLSTLSKNLEGIRLKSESDFTPSINNHSAAAQLRKWLQQGEGFLEKVRVETFECGASPTDLHRLRAALQTLQLEIDTEGRQLLRAAKRHLTNRALDPQADGKKVGRLQRNLEVLEQRWLNLYLGGIEEGERVNNLVQHFQGFVECGSEEESVDSQEPARKRRRTLEAVDGLEQMLTELTEDRGTDGNDGRDRPIAEPLHRVSSADDDCSSIKTHDVGYSSGDNSFHEALNSIVSTCDVTSEPMRGGNICIYYKTVPLDEAGATDNEAPARGPPGIKVDLPDEEAPQQAEPDDPRVDSARVDSARHVDHYSEIMSILNEVHAGPPLGTSWQELRPASARRLSTMPARSVRPPPSLASGTMSCDASSEDSDVQAPQKSESFSKHALAAFSGSQPQVCTPRKRRYPRLPTVKTSGLFASSAFLRGISMDQSVYESRNDLMSQSLNLPAKTGRTRFLKRRMHRSASENDHKLVFGRTLHRRESINSNSSSTIFQESGDAHFEWDDYKDEALVEDVVMGGEQALSFHSDSSVPLLTPLIADDDFQQELPLMDASEQAQVEEFVARSRAALFGAQQDLRNAEGAERGRHGQEASKTAADNLRNIRAFMTSIADPACIENLNELHGQWMGLIDEFGLAVSEALSPSEIAEVMDLFRTIRYHYKMFASMCNVPDSKLVTECSLDDLRVTLKTRKKMFKQLRANYMRMTTLVSKVPSLLPELEKVSENIDNLNESVANLEKFCDLYAIREKVEEVQSNFAELDRIIVKQESDCAPNLNTALLSRLREVDEELCHCQDRMSSLEHVCNGILSKMNALSTEFEEDDYECCTRFVAHFKEMQVALQHVKERLDVLYRLHPLYRPGSQQHDDSYSDSSTSETGGKLGKRRSAVSSSVADSPATKLRGHLVAGWQESAALRSLVACVLLLGLGAALLGLFADEEVLARSGHWAFRFGPQLRYVDGVPPV